MSSTTFANVTVLGKLGCKLCDSAKDKLKLMDIPFKFKEIQPFLELHDGWRKDGSVDILAAYHHHERVLPIISIDGQCFNYPLAMNYIKTKQVKVSVAPVKKEALLVSA